MLTNHGRLWPEYYACCRLCGRMAATSRRTREAACTKLVAEGWAMVGGKWFCREHAHLATDDTGRS